MKDGEVRGFSTPPADDGMEMQQPVESSEAGMESEFLDQSLGIAELAAERDSYLDQLQRTAADYANYRRRTENERVQMRKNATRDLLAQLAPIADDFERAMANIPPDQADTSLAVGVGEMLLPFLSLLGLLLFLGALALLLSMLLPSQRMAVLAAGLLLVASYIINSLGRIDPGLVKLDPYLPLHYYQGGMAIDGVEWGWLAGLLGCALLFSLLAWRLFEKRQIRVSGEAGWHLP